MTEPFDTVSEVKSWLETEPSRSEAEEALAVELDTEDRKTAKSAIRAYLSELEEPTPTESEAITDEVADEDSGGDGKTLDFRVRRNYDNHSIGDVVSLDPDSTECDRLRRGGYVVLN